MSPSRRRRRALEDASRDEIVGPDGWTWHRFHDEVRPTPAPLLAELHRFARPILVGGCQRSGTTLLAQLLARSDGLTACSSSAASELETALVLAGRLPYRPVGRHVLQTTYLNERYREYVTLPEDARLVWCLRNPHSVVASLLHNWSRDALERTFRSCGAGELSRATRLRHRLPGGRRLRRLDRACAVYTGKTRQLLELAPRLGAHLWVVDYDALVRERDAALEPLYRFLGVAYHPKYAEAIHARSLSKRERLSERARARIAQRCGPVHAAAQALVGRP